MMCDIPEAGSAGLEVRLLAQSKWFEMASKDGSTFSLIPPEATLEVRVAAARAAGYEIGGVLSRYSTKLQNSTDDQVRECVECAARNMIYVPPEFICVDEAKSGRKLDRDGLNRMKALLKARQVSTLLVY